MYVQDRNTRRFIFRFWIYVLDKLVRAIITQHNIMTCIKSVIVLFFSRLLIV